jgi:hypothetical protein
MNPDISHQRVVYVLLHNWYPVHIELLNCVRLLMQGVQFLLAPGKAYKAKDLCGHAFWALLEKGERRLVGSCISHLVRTDELQLTKLNDEGTYPNRYELQLQ